MQHSKTLRYCVLKALMISSILLLASLPDAWSQSVKITGKVLNEDTYKLITDSVLVNIVIRDATKIADFEKGIYTCYFNPDKVLNQRVCLKAFHPNYRQEHIPNFTITEPGETKEHIFLYPRLLYVGDVLKAAQRQRRKNPYEALTQVHALLVDLPSPLLESSLREFSWNVYNLYSELIGDVILKDATIEARFVKPYVNLDGDNIFQSFLEHQRWDYYREIAKSLGHMKDSSSAKVDMVLSFYDLVIEACSKAIAIRPWHPEAYQAMYQLQGENGDFFDEMETIRSFFSKNVNVNSERTVRAFLTEWCTSLENASGKGNSSEAEYIVFLRSDQTIAEEWKKLKRTLLEYARFYEHKSGDNGGYLRSMRDESVRIVKEIEKNG